MTYTLSFTLGLGTAGYSDLRAQLFDTAGTNSGSAISSGFAEIGSGWYTWNYASIPNGFRGGVKFYRNSAPSTILACGAINPEDAEYLDTRVSGVLGTGNGAIDFTYTLTNSVDGSPIENADIWITSDSAGSNLLASGQTDANGQITFFLDAGTVYVWRQKAGWDFNNPDAEVIS